MKTGNGSICQFEELTNHNDKEEKGLLYHNQSAKDFKTTHTRPSTCTQCNRPMAGGLDSQDNKNINTRSAAYFSNQKGQQHQTTTTCAHSRGTLNEIIEKPPGKRI